MDKMPPHSRSPLHGTKTHPLTDAARRALRQLVPSEFPAQEFNPGVVNRLLREDLVELVALPSPYATHIGRKVNINFLRITDAGRAAIRAPTTTRGGAYGSAPERI